MYLFYPDLSKLYSTDVWIKAANQVIFMLGLGLGGNILFASYRNENEDIYFSSYMIPLMTIGCGMLCSIINFCYLGHVSFISKVAIDDLPLKGTDLAFITYPSALTLLPYPNLWSIVFFIMLITLGIDSQV
jgi:SNF family Na+-dependent transporter